MDSERLKKQIDFIIEVDKLKTIYRRSYIADSSRKENDAEHSWHIALMAMILQEQSQNKDIDLLKVIKMLLIHDLVEIYAGDVIVYDLTQRHEQEQKEKAASKKLFSLLPEDQNKEYIALWTEFEENETDEARFAHALDRLQPMLLNYATHGKTWQEAHIKSGDVLTVNKIINKGSEGLWNFARELVRDAVDKSFLEE